MNVPSPGTGTVRLGHLGVIRARGADATTFLQGQLTNDVVALGPTEARLAGFCSAKGRLQASFIVWKPADDDVFLACAADLLAATLRRLSMFVLRAHCKLVDASLECPLQGLVGAAAQASGGDLAPWERRARGTRSVIRLPDADGLARAIAVGAPVEEADTAADPTAPGLDLDRWRWLEIESGIPTIEAATADRFVPQMINFETVGGVDFRKGCYPGQEIVARSQYRGTIKRRMALFDAPVPLVPADEVYHAADPAQPAGMVVNAAPHPAGGWSALVEVKLSALEGADLRLRAADGPRLARRPLPYAVEAPA